MAGLHLEDQLSPKRCGHLEGKQLIAAGEMVEKVHAAVEARRSADLVIIARTDARAVEGLDAALERARRYRDAGADVLFVEAPESEAEVARWREAFPETPLLFNAVEGGRTPLLELARLRELGFRLVLCPLTALLAATAAVQQALAGLRRSGTPHDDGALSFSGFTDLIGLPEIQRLEARYAARRARTPGSRHRASDARPPRAMPRHGRRLGSWRQAAAMAPRDCAAAVARLAAGKRIRYRRKRNGESACAQRPGPVPRLRGLDRRRRAAQHARPRAAGRRARLPPLLAGRAPRRHHARRAEPRGPDRARSRWPPSASAWAAAA